ncbi:MAG TPA: methionine--tRNA ligase [Methylomirabilota bacterium]|nr:methionine--tRNA ligase [Methylomirabilota bacterium]
MSDNVFYLTTPIYYPNAAPHLGSAGTTMMADAMCRYRRLRGDRVWFLTGTDEHGDKMAQVAEKEGISPQAFVDRIAALYKEEWRRLGITNDDFIRTTEPRHEKVVQQILQRLWDKGEIYLGEYSGQYCFGCERFYTEKEIVDGRCPDHQIPLTFIKEDNYLFRMSKYQARLVKHLEEHPEFIQPERYRNEVLGFLREPLQDLSISRPKARLAWGIPLPFDDQHVTYVWFDALINYVSALGYPDDERYKTFWPHAIHLIGKDIVKAHGVYWPTMLWAADLPLYKGLRVHGYWSVEGRKMSKSLGNVVGAWTLSQKYGSEVIRYFVLREMHFGLDADFSEEAVVGRLNADLANDLGNLVSRATTVMVNFGSGVIPPFPSTQTRPEEIDDSFEHVHKIVSESMEDFAFYRALESIWSLIGRANRYIDAKQPWALAKDPGKRAELDAVLNTLGQVLNVIGTYLLPFLPEAADKICAGIGASRTLPQYPFWNRLPAGTRVEKVSGLFPRVDTKAADAKTPAASAPKADAKAEGKISLADFQKVDLRVAEVLAAEKVAKSKKLLKLTVKVGEDTRTLVAGIAEHYSPDALIGRKIVVVANLEPATLMGIESNGMVLAGSSGESLGLIALDRDLPPGAKVK